MSDSPSRDVTRLPIRIPTRKRMVCVRESCKPIDERQPISKEEYNKRVLLTYDQLLPSWRWYRAYEAQKTFHTLDDYMPATGEDEFVATRLIPFIYMYNNKNRRPDIKFQLQQHYSDMLWCRSIYESYHMDRWALEAFLVSGVTYKEIAGHFFTSPENIEAYEKSYFNVSNRLDNKVYMLTRVFSIASNKSGSAMLEDVAWKMVAWKHSCGAEAFIGLLDITKALPPMVDEVLNRNIRRKIVDDVLQMMLTNRPNSFNQEFKAQNYYKMLEHQLAEAKVNDDAEYGNEYLRTLLNHLSTAVNMAKPGQFEAIEPRAANMLANIYKDRSPAKTIK